VLSSVKDGPGDAAGVLSLQEQRLRLALLEAEDLAVTTDKELTLLSKSSQSSIFKVFLKAKANHDPSSSARKLQHRRSIEWHENIWDSAYLARVDSLTGECVVVGTHLVALSGLWRQGVVGGPWIWRWQKLVS
jgi:hypothetical protein